MADYRVIIPHILKSEGGLSRATTDTASKDPCPTPYKGVTGYHTNKGVTYTTWKHFFGTKNDARFFAMSAADWELIFKKGYWDTIKGDEIKNQAIANYLADWSWGAYYVTAIKNAQQVLNRSFGYKLATDGKIGPSTLAAINAVNPTKFLELLRQEHLDFYAQIVKNNPSQSVYIKGWTARVNELYAVSQKYLTVTAISLGAVFFLLLTAFGIYKFTQTKKLRHEMA
jgi:lysozyme family protein